MVIAMDNCDKIHTCCFFGHRKIKETPELESKLIEVIEDLIINRDVTSFLFGSKSEFDLYCKSILDRLKEKHPHIKRVYVRSAFQHIPAWYEDSLLEHYEDTYFPEQIENSGRASYVERNQDMIDHSQYCVVYYDENYLPPRRKNSRRDLTDYRPKSGTKVAYNYAVRKNKEIINVYE